MGDPNHHDARYTTTHATTNAAGRSRNTQGTCCACATRASATPATSGGCGRLTATTTASATARRATASRELQIALTASATRSALTANRRGSAACVKICFIPASRWPRTRSARHALHAVRTTASAAAALAWRSRSEQEPSGALSVITGSGFTRKLSGELVESNFNDRTTQTALDPLAGSRFVPGSGDLELQLPTGASVCVRCVCVPT